MSISSIYEYYTVFRMIISNYLKSNMPFIELNGIIEIDETFIGARMRGRIGRVPAKHQVIFGLYSRDTKQILIYLLDSKSRNDIIPILIDHIGIGSVIYSDKASMYVNPKENRSFLETLGLDYTHFWVNHSEEWVNQIFGEIHINSLERVWRSLKNSISHIKLGGLKRQILQSYIDTFLARINTNEEIFYDVFLHILRTEFMEQ